MLERLLDLSNEHLRLEVFADASACIHDGGTGTTWRMASHAMQDEGTVDVGHTWQRTDRSICEQYVATFRGTRVDANHVVFERIDELGRARGTVKAGYFLDGKHLEVTVPEISPDIPSLLFPPTLEAESLVLPSQAGRWLRRPVPSSTRKVYRYLASLNMRWFGGLRGDSGWLAIVPEGFADGGVQITGMNATALWLQSLGRWDYPRRLRYAFVRGGYVELAKAYRAWAEGAGLVKTLEEKIEEKPEVRHLIGGPQICFFMGRPYRRERFTHYGFQIPAHVRDQPEGLQVFLTFRDVARIKEEIKALGMRRGIFSLHGWIQGGYDETHPDVWPPDAAFGTVEELRELSSEKDPYFLLLHDNYQDIYRQSPSFPKGTCKQRDGSPLAGGIWMGGQCYILNSEAALGYARRNWPHFADIGLRAMYSDTISAELFKQSWEYGAEQTRQQDHDGKIELMKFFREQGLILSSENGADFAVPYLHTAPAGNHERAAGETVPLWSLVFHDCIVSHLHLNVFSPDTPVNDPRLTSLLCAAWGYAPMFGGFSAQSWEAVKGGFAYVPPLADLHEVIGLTPMVGHRMVTSDAAVEETTYANGQRVLVNFSPEAQRIEGVELAGQSWKLQDV